MNPGDGSTRLPVWVLVYWKRLRNALDAKCKWIAAKNWLHTISCDDHPMSGLAHEALHSFTHLGWNTSMRGPATHLQTLDIAYFLSESRVCGGIVDAMMYRLAE